jgi:DHA3 family macrolide efflux protein-like MFS transporter
MFAKENWKINFALLWSGQVLSLIGTSIIHFALIWWLTEKTGSAIMLSFATLAALIPEIFIGPLFGPIIDRWNRKKILFQSGFVISIAGLLLGIGFQINIIVPWMVLAGLLVRSTANVCRWPALNAAAAQIVPEKYLTRINAVDYMIRGLSNIIGPITGAILINTVSMQAIMSVEIITVLIGFIPLMLIAIPGTQKSAEPLPKLNAMISRNWKEMKDGFRYVRRKPGLFELLGYVSLTNLLLIPGDSLLPLMISDHFGGGATELGIMGMAFGIGSVIGSIFLGISGGFKSRIKTSISGDLLYGIGVLLVGTASKDQFITAIFGWSVAGFGEALSLAMLNALLQSRTRPEMQGRVFSISTSLINLSVPLAMIVSGPAAEIFGVHYWYIFSGISVLILSASVMYIPSIFRFERNKPIETYERL